MVAAEHPMEIFPPEDALELLQRHAVVDLLEFRCLLIFFKDFQPVRLGQGRQRADQRLPFDDRQAGMRQAGDAADHQRGENHRGANKKPDGDLAAGSGLHRDRYKD
jgi:hypothetical protein